MQERFSNDENRPMEIASAVCERSFGTGGFSTERCFKRPLDHALFQLVSLCHFVEMYATKASVLSTVDIADALLTESESDISIGQ
jgi:hypothetical protein